MKTFLSLLFLGLLASVNTAFADSRAYCDRLDQLDNLQHLTSDQFKNFFIDGTKVDRILVSKDRKKLYVLRDDVVLKSYDVALGRNPYGPKQFEGDNKTPEGIYTVDSKNAESAFHKALHVSYPTKEQVDYAKSQGKSAGGDIMIHGFPVDPAKNAMVSAVHPGYNWTAGCIAVTDLEIDQIFQMTTKGTTVEICKSSPPPDPENPQPPQNPAEQ